MEFRFANFIKKGARAFASAISARPDMNKILMAILVIPLCLGVGCCKKNEPREEVVVPMPEKHPTNNVKPVEPDPPHVKSVEDERYEESDRVAKEATESF